jgi:ABC-type uncharacterized transport system fused permease/ATPase subunit
VNRLVDFGEALVKAKDLTSSSSAIHVTRDSAPEVPVNNLTIALPDRRVLLDDLPSMLEITWVVSGQLGPARAP